MIPPEKLIEILTETFEKSAINDFKNFLLENHSVKKWMIAADYCIGDKTRPNDVFAFTLIPYDDHLDTLKREITNSLPNDIKGTKTITGNAVSFLKSGRRFHFAFVFNETPKVFNNGPGSVPTIVVKDCLDLTIAKLDQSGRTSENLKNIKLLRQKANSKSFNVNLISNMFILSYLFTFVTITLVKEREIEKIGWFSDRDKMTIWCNGVVWNLGLENTLGMASLFGLKIPDGDPIIGVEPTSQQKGKMWFDEMIRIPDYVAGVIATWNFNKNFQNRAEKFEELTRSFLADTANLAIIKIRWTDALQASRIIFHKDI